MSSWLPTWLGGTPSPTVQATRARDIRPPVTKTTSEVIEQLDDTMEGLETRILKAEQEAYTLEKRAKDLHKKGNKKQAIALMTQKKQKDKQIEQLQGQVLNMQQASSAVQHTAVAIDVAAGMRDGADMMKEMLQQVSVDDVTSAADDMAENIGQAEQLFDALSTPMGAVPVDEDDMDATFAQWEQEEAEAREEKNPEEAMDLPSVPTNEPKPPPNNAATVEETPKEPVQTL